MGLVGGWGWQTLTFITHSAGSVIAHDLLYHMFREEEDDQVAAVNEVRRLVKARRLRIRRFYTMGSPITPLVFRANSLLVKAMKQEQLDPEDIGLRKRDRLANPRWVNFWDRDDILSYPLSFLYQTSPQNPVIEDKYLDLGDFSPAVHLKYWESPEVARYIAETF